MKLNLWIIAGAAGALLLLPMRVQAAQDYDVQNELDKMMQELDLNRQQVRDVEPILEDYKAQLDKAEREKREKLDKVLNEAQMNRFETMDQTWLDKIKSRFEGPAEDTGTGTTRDEKARDRKIDRKTTY